MAQRAREFGVRLALGARPGQLLQLVLMQSLKICAIGLAVALPLAVILSEMMANFLFGVVALNVTILAALAALLLAVLVGGGVRSGAAGQRMSIPSSRCVMSKLWQTGDV